MNDSNDFYKTLSSFYHLIFENWDTSINQQGKILSAILPNAIKEFPVLDCACGIGTQALSLATLGYQVEGSDISEDEIKRARGEAVKRNLSIEFRVDDMRNLLSAQLNRYGAVIAMDNSLPHLNSDDDIISALTSMCHRLRKGGVILLSLRDYEKLMREQPSFTEPKFYQDGPYRRIVHQVWDWQDERHYTLHLYITIDSKEGWKSFHFVGNYRAITLEEVLNIAKNVGLVKLKVLNPSETGFYQPIIYGEKK